MYILKKIQFAQYVIRYPENKSINKFRQSNTVVVLSVKKIST